MHTISLDSNLIMQPIPINPIALKAIVSYNGTYTVWVALPFAELI